MAITLLYGCCQIETTLRDMDAAVGFFRSGLGGGLIEQKLAQQIDTIAPETSYRCDHVGLGEAVFQLNQPDPAMVFNGHPSIHQVYLDHQGPCVTNLNYFIDDHEHARELLLEMGCPLHLEGPSSAAPALADYGPDNTRPGGDERPFMFIGTRHLIGFDLEIMEPNFLHFTRQTVQYPAFVHPRPAVDDGNLLLRRLRVVVPSIEDVWSNIDRIFTPGCRSRPYYYRAGPLGRSMRISFGGMEIEYCEPAGHAGPQAELLERHGGGAVAAEFAADDIDIALARCRDMAWSCSEPDWLGNREQVLRPLIASRDSIGFDVILEPMTADRGVEQNGCLT